MSDDKPSVFSYPYSDQGAPKIALRFWVSQNIYLSLVMQSKLIAVSTLRHSNRDRRA
jgi:hypothetical protein